MQISSYPVDAESKMIMPHREPVLLKIGQKQVIPWTCGGERPGKCTMKIVKQGGTADKMLIRPWQSMALSGIFYLGGIYMKLYTKRWRICL